MYSTLNRAVIIRVELNTTVKFVEIQEGVRALLIEKDNSPVWKFVTIAGIDQESKDWFISSKWLESEHPLAAL